MRIRWLRLTLILLLLGPAVWSRPQVEVEAALDPVEMTIAGRLAAKLGSDSGPFHDLRFTLYPNLGCNSTEQCDIRVDSMTVNGVDVTGLMQIDKTDLYVVLPETVPRADTTVAKLWFVSHIPRKAARFGYDNRQFFLEHWFPYPSPLKNGVWQVYDYRSFLEPASDPIDYRATVIYPDSLQLIAPGVQLVDSSGGTANARLELQAAVSLPLFFATDYEPYRSTVGDVAVTIYVRPSGSYIVDSVRTAVERTINWMGDFGLPFPFDEFLVVLGGFTRGGALEQPHMILMPEQRASFFKMYQLALIHEVVHQWFYALVCSNTAIDPWMDESVTEYFTLKIQREITATPYDFLSVWGIGASGNLLARASAYDYLDYLPVTYAGEQYFNERQYYGAIYAKGPLIIRTLTAHMGADNERGFWQDYVQTYGQRTPTPDEFMALADKYLPYAEGTAREIMANVRAVDFQVISLENRPIQREVDSSDTARIQRQSFEVEVIYRAVQPLDLPVTLQIQFYDGSVKDTLLSGRVGTFSLTVESESAARAAVIDPHFEYAIDMDLLNNSLTLDQSRGAGLRLFSGLVYLVESLFSTLWGY